MVRNVSPSARLSDQGAQCPVTRQLSPYFKHRNLFKKYLRKQRRNQSLFYFLLSWNSLDIIISFSLKTYKAFAAFVPAYCFQRILKALESHDPAKRPEAYGFAFLMFLANCSFAQLDMFEAWHSRRNYERTRGVIFCALHWKALKRRDMSGKLSEKGGEERGELEEGESMVSDIGRCVCWSCLWR